MRALDRRPLLGALATMLSVLVSRPALSQAAAASLAWPAGASINPPSEPMVYARRLVRGLTGNAQFTVERQFAVRFTPAEDGYRVEGEQIAIAVEAPERLAALADLERARTDIGLFPIALDRRGWIRSGMFEDDVPAIDAAVSYVSQVVASAGRPADEHRMLREFVAAIHRAGSAVVSSLPVDLFAPAEEARVEQRTMTLPGGGTGTVTTRFTASRDPVTGLMRHARREVVTVVGEDERRTVETFTLEPEAALRP